jgi:hyaluronoglucosaminidase
VDGDERPYTGLQAAGAPDGALARILSGLQEDSGPSPLLVTCVRKADDSLARDPVTGFRHDEGYRVVTEGRGEVRVEFTSSRGLRYALSTLIALIKSGGMRERLEIHDTPRFPIRGVIEGFYGPPWEPEARRGLLKLMADRKMNTYFYGPKDDVFHRARWSELYPSDKLSELEAAFALATELDMDFWYTVGPGLSIEYANRSDFAALRKKLAQVAELGITKFGLLYDDIPEHLQHERDVNEFKSLPEAHSTLANRLYLELREELPIVRFAVCPTQYHGLGNEAYISELGGRLDPRIELLWTGPEICSRELTLRDAAVFERTCSRPVLYWDNYPVNDAQMTDEMHIGPYRGRDPHLYRASLGVVANGMEYPEASKIGLLTVADYLWNPEDYDPEESWDDALRTIVGDADFEAFKAFADNSRYSALYPTDSPYLSERLQHARFLAGTGREADALSVLQETAAHLQTAVELFDRGMENTVLEQEILRWIMKYRKGVALLNAYIDQFVGREGSADAFVAAREEYVSDRTYLFADILNEVGV